jgi:hypothetical protein
VAVVVAVAGKKRGRGPTFRLILPPSPSGSPHREHVEATAAYLEQLRAAWEGGNGGALLLALDTYLAHPYERPAWLVDSVRECLGAWCANRNMSLDRAFRVRKRSKTWARHEALRFPILVRVGKFYWDRHLAIDEHLFAAVAKSLIQDRVVDHIDRSMVARIYYQRRSKDLRVKFLLPL